MSSRARAEIRASKPSRTRSVAPSQQVKRSRIMFVVLAHEHPDILAEQIRNIKFYNPDSSILLYNSSGDPAFGQGIGDVTVCPYSRGPLAWGRTGCVLYDAIRWLRDTDADYDYLVYIDSDVVFVRPGLEFFLDETMQGYDCMGVDIHVEHAPDTWIPGQTMWREWELWRVLFHTDYLAGMFANGQIYRRDLVNRMYDGIDTVRLEWMFQTTQVVALEEILHATLAVRSGSAYRSMPEPAARFIRFIPPLVLEEIQAAAQTEGVYFVHPVPRDRNDPARSWSIATTPVYAPSVQVPPEIIHSVSLKTKPKRRPRKHKSSALSRRPRKRRAVKKRRRIFRREAHSPKKKNRVTKAFSKGSFPKGAQA